MQRSGEKGAAEKDPTFKGQSKGECQRWRKGGPNRIPNPSSSTSASSSTSTTEHTPQPPGGGPDAEGLFQFFWECYPLKVKKPKALEAFLKLKPDRTLLDRMLEAIGRQKKPPWRKDNGQFIPHPATWLNNRQWEDSIMPDLAEGSVWDEFIGKPEKEEIMNEKQLAKWLMDLAACYDYVPQKAAISRYLRILTMEAQSRPVGRARGPRRDPPDQEFPMPGDLQEIVSELLQGRGTARKFEHLDRMRADWQQQVEGV